MRLERVLELLIGFKFEAVAKFNLEEYIVFWDLNLATNKEIGPNK